MTTPQETLDLEDDQMDDDPQDRTPQQLRDAAKRGTEARREADRLAREVAMLKAGIDTDSPIGSMFAKSYDGDLTKEAVASAWTALGITPSDTPTTPDVDLEPGETDSTSQRQALANGADVTPPATPDPKVSSVEDALATIKRGGTTEDAIAQMFSARATAAAAGDTRVIIDPFS